MAAAILPFILGNLIPTLTKMNADMMKIMSYLKYLTPTSAWASGMGSFQTLYSLRGIQKITLAVLFGWDNLGR